MKSIKKNVDMNKAARRFIINGMTRPLLSVSVAIALGLSNLAEASTQDVEMQSNWQPVASESLMKLPANLIEKRIQQDFEMSPMAQALLAVEQQVVGQSEQIRSLQSLIKEAAKGDLVEERVSLVQLKSSYLDLMQQSQALRQEALDKKQSLYQDVLSQMLLQSGKANNKEFVRLQQQQEKARQRMQSVIDQVDKTIMHEGYDKPSPYADEFAVNLDKIEQLKAAISQHKASLAPTIDGVEVTAQEYVRQLLMQASGEQSLLDQESLMLSYMAKLVALDAQALEYEIAYQPQEDGSLTNAQMSKPAQSVDLFL